MQEALEEPQRVQLLARARLLADAAHATTAGMPLLPTTAPAPAAARIAGRRLAGGMPPPTVSVAEEAENGAIAGVLDAVAVSGRLAPDVFLELLSLMAMPWDPARGKGRQRWRQREGEGSRGGQDGE